MAVFVLDKRGKPLMPCSEKRARKLLGAKRARVHRVKPFTIRLIDVSAENCSFQPVRLKIDPGSKQTGMALVREAENGVQVVLNLFHLIHRGTVISKKLLSRANFRRNRRSRLRYRQSRFLNRTKPKGWLAPSLMHRVNTTMSWVKRFMKWLPLTGISNEWVKFDTQAMQNPEISGKEYQQGTLAGYEVREYLLEKWKRTCAYCDAKNVPLQVEHVVARINGGSNRPSNLTLACGDCNQAKGALDIRVFLAHDQPRLAKILKRLKTPLRDAAAMNATRWKLMGKLRSAMLPLELSTGARTKYNRTRLMLPKTHGIDAACVGVVSQVQKWKIPTLRIACVGRGRYSRTIPNKHGFPRNYLMKNKFMFGFKTGDLVTALICKGVNIGVYIGTTVVRASGYFKLDTSNRLIESVPVSCLRLIQRSDGYKYLLF